MQRPRPGVRGSGVPPERPLDPALPLTQIAAHPPEVPEGSHQLDPDVPVTLLHRPAERRPQIVALPLQALEPRDLTRAQQLGLGLLGEGQHIDSVATPDELGLSGLDQALPPVLSGGLEQPIPTDLPLALDLDE